MKIDDASWHYGGKGFPEELSPEAERQQIANQNTATLTYLGVLKVERFATIRLRSSC